MKKRIFALLIAGILVLSGCGGAVQSGSDTTTATNSSTTASADVETDLDSTEKYQCVKVDTSNEANADKIFCDEKIDIEDDDYVKFIGANNDTCINFDILIYLNQGDNGVSEGDAKVIAASACSYIDQILDRFDLDKDYDGKEMLVMVTVYFGNDDSFSYLILDSRISGKQYGGVDENGDSYEGTPDWINDDTVLDDIDSNEYTDDGQIVYAIYSELERIIDEYPELSAYISDAYK